MTIRVAHPEEAEAILNVQQASIRSIPTSFYPAEVLNAWAGSVTPERIDKVRVAIESGDEVFIVAVAGARLMGFGAIMPNSKRLRALYVHPQFWNRGVGKAILNELERHAVSLGVTRLEMDASINAEEFYKRHGFVTMEHGIHRFHAGGEITCARMVRVLGDSGGHADCSMI